MGYRLNCLDEPVFMAGSMAFILDWRVVRTYAGEKLLSIVLAHKDMKHVLSIVWITEIIISASTIDDEKRCFSSKQPCTCRITSSEVGILLINSPSLLSFQSLVLESCWQHCHKWFIGMSNLSKSLQWQKWPKQNESQEKTPSGITLYLVVFF